MRSCDCVKSNPVQTSEYVICRNCGIEIGQIFEDDLSHEQVAHFANPLTMVNVHPSINKTLSELSFFVDMKMETRMDIIDRANQISKMGLNYIISTKRAFSEIFPKINIGQTPKIKEVFDTQKQKHTNGGVCFGATCNAKENICSNSYLNKYMINKKIQANILIKNGKKKNRKIKETLKNAKIPEWTYYRYRNLDFTHKRDKNGKFTTKKINYEVHHYILNNIEKKLKDLQYEILYTFFVDLTTSAIWKHKQKIKNKTTL